MSNTVLPAVMVKRDAAKYLGVSVTTIERIAASGELTIIRYPGVRKDFFRKADLDRLIQASATTLPPTMSETMSVGRSKWGQLDVARGLKKNASR